MLRAGAGLSDIGARIQTAEREASEAEAALGGERKRLRPPVDDERVLAEMPVPPRSAVQEHRDAVRALADASKSVNERVVAAEREIDQQRKVLERFVRDEQVVTEEELVRIRLERDEGWPACGM